MKRPGPTGDYPYGKLRPDDQGGLEMLVTRNRGRVVIAFGTPVHWIGFGPKEARALASMLIEHASALEGSS